MDAKALEDALAEYGDQECPYTVKVTLSGDVAEAQDLASALTAAWTLVADHQSALGTQGAAKAARDSLYVLRDGLYDGLATTLARAGHREPLSAAWSR